MNFVIDNALEILTILLSGLIAWKQYSLEKKISSESYLNNAKSEFTKVYNNKKLDFVLILNKKLNELTKYLDIIPKHIGSESEQDNLDSAKNLVREIRDILIINEVFLYKVSEKCFSFINTYEKFLETFKSRSKSPEFDEKRSQISGSTPYFDWQILQIDLYVSFVNLIIDLSTEARSMNIENL